MTGRRADQELVARGLAESRAQAQAAIAAGLVTADGRLVRKSSETIAPSAEIVAGRAYPDVSRGGLKLAAALDHFRIDPEGLSCLDIGASTGGFTDVLLKRGAAHVTAIDTGRGQLHPDLLSDPRVDSREGTDIRMLEPAMLVHCPQLAVIDVSFISLRLVLPKAIALLAARSQLVALIKPQFEVGRARIGKGGIVRDEAARRSAVDDVLGLLASLDFRCRGTIASPITGGDGNQEYLVAAERG